MKIHCIEKKSRQNLLCVLNKPIHIFSIQNMVGKTLKIQIVKILFTDVHCNNLFFLVINISFTTNDREFRVLSLQILSVMSLFECYK